MLTYALLCAVLVCWLLHYKWRQRAVIKMVQNIPGNKGWPIIGNAGELFAIKNIAEVYNFAQMTADRYSEYGIIKFWFGTLLAIGVWEPEYIEIIANSPASAEKGNIYQLVLGNLFNGCVVSSGARWRELRRPVSRTLSRRALDLDYFPVFSRRTKRFLQFLDHRTGVLCDVGPEIGAYALDIFAETHFGLDMDEVSDRTWNIHHYIKEFISTMFQLTINYHPYFMNIIYKFTKYAKVLDESLQKSLLFFHWILDERKKSTNHAKEGMEYYPDFLLKRGKEKNIPLAELAKELGDMYLAGVDTSTTVGSSLLVFLGMFPEVQEKVYQEQVSLLGDLDPTIDDLASMVYLEMVIKETLRHVSPPGVIKYSTAEMEIGKYKIPAGTIIYLFLQRLQHDPRFWERPQEFYPEHFLPAQEAARPRYAFNPFGCGPRSCPGSLYAIYELKVLISYIIRRYKISTNIKFEEIVYNYMLLLEMGKFNVMFERR